MREYQNETTYEKHKMVARKELESRLEILESRVSKGIRITKGMEIELEKCKIWLEKFDSIDEKTFKEIPGSGLACDWIEKFENEIK